MGDTIIGGSITMINMPLQRLCDSLVELTSSSITDLVDEAIRITGVKQDDIIEVPTKKDLMGNAFPFSANVMVLADKLIGSKALRKVRITRVFVLSDHEGHASLNWGGNLLLPSGHWHDYEVLVARVGGPQ
jgi:hypothetical protein